MYKKIIIYQHESEMTGHPMSAAAEALTLVNSFQEGLKKHGIEVEKRKLEDPFEKSDLAVFWGSGKKDSKRGRKIIELENFLKEENLNWITIERGYVKRDGHWMVGFNGLNGRADFKNKNMPSDRWEQLDVELEEWQTGGENILFCGQVPWDASVQCVPNYDSWLDRAVEKVSDLSRREIVFRPHPDLLSTNPMMLFAADEDLESEAFLRRHGIQVPAHASRISTNRKAPLEEEFKNAWITISLNSNSGVDSIIKGVPTVAFDEGSMALSMSTRLEDVESPLKPDRAQWAYDLAYSQWTPEEIAKGITWEHLNR